MIQVIRTVMRLLGFRNSDLERKLGVSPGYLSRVFSGGIELRFDLIAELAELVGLRVDELFRFAYPETGEAPSEMALRLREATETFRPALPVVQAGPSPEELERVVTRSLRRFFGGLRGRQRESRPGLDLHPGPACWRSAPTVETPRGASPAAAPSMSRNPRDTVGTSRGGDAPRGVSTAGDAAYRSETPSAKAPQNSSSLSEKRMFGFTSARQRNPVTRLRRERSATLISNASRRITTAAIASGPIRRDVKTATDSKAICLASLVLR
jgi:transcriptional regulator with XRE-family HTH domain